MSIKIKNGEAKTITFSVTDASNQALDLSDIDAVDFRVKSSYSDATNYIAKSTALFDLTNAANGVISVDLSSGNTNAASIPAGTYISELRITFTSSNVDISKNIPFIVERSVF